MTEFEEMKAGIEAREELERAHYEACQESEYYEGVYAETGCPDANNLAHRAQEKCDALWAQLCELTPRPETCPQVDDLPF